MHGADSYRGSIKGSRFGIAPLEVLVAAGSSEGSAGEGCIRVISSIAGHSARAGNKHTWEFGSPVQMEGEHELGYADIVVATWGLY